MTKNPVQEADTRDIEDTMRQASQLQADGRLHDARLLCQELHSRYPDRADILFALGGCLFNEKEYLNALAIFSKACNLDPDNADYRAWTGICLRANHKEPEGIQALHQALTLDSKNLTALQELSYISTSKLRNRESVEYSQRALEINPANHNVNANLAMSLARLGQYEEALKYANKAARISPKNDMVYRALGEIHLLFGHIKEGLQQYHKALSVNPKNYIIYYNIVSAEKIKNADDSIIKRMEKCLHKSMDSDSRMFLHYALGKAYDDTKQWDKAFMHFEKANDLVHSEFDLKIHSAQIAKYRKIFTKDYFAQYKTPKAERSTTPIFIIGMPRSGSTLTDQILSSHSKVRSVGESQAIEEIINQIHADAMPKGEYPDSLRNIPKDKLDEYRNYYQDITQKEADNAKYIVDKMPFNFMYLGIIAILFPNAKIIHTMRHPLDIGLSCFNMGFGMFEQTWAHKLEYIGQYYRDYSRLMDHWRNVLPIQILDVQYENVVSDLETDARRVLEYCGLEWEPECLEFYKTKRSVVTASLVQVRQPIYSSSVARWVPYAKHLQPLVTALGDVLKDDAPRLQELGLTVNTKQPLLQRVSAFFHS